MEFHSPVLDRLIPHCSPIISFRWSHIPPSVPATCRYEGGGVGNVFLGFLPKDRERSHEAISTGAALHARPRSEVVCEAWQAIWRGYPAGCLTRSSRNRPGVVRSG